MLRALRLGSLAAVAACNVAPTGGLLCPANTIARADGTCEPLARLPVEVSPLVLDLGILRPDEVGSGELRLINRGAEPQGVAIGAPTLPFVIASGGDLEELGSGEGRTVRIEVSSSEEGERIGSLIVDACAPDGCDVEVRLTASIQSPVPLLACTPDLLDFGTVRISECRSAALRCENVSDGAIDTTGALLSGDGRDTISTIFFGGDVLPGREAAIDVVFCPNRQGPFDLRFHLEGTGDGGAPVTSNEVQLAGRGTDPGRCAYRVIGTFSFGRIDVGGFAEREVRIEQVAGQGCEVRMVGLDASTSQGFRILSPVPDAQTVLETGESWPVLVRIDGDRPGRYEGAVVLETRGSADPVLSIPMSAIVEDPSVTGYRIERTDDVDFLVADQVNRFNWVPSADDGAFEIPLSFDFTFADVVSSSVFVGTNGFLAFGGPSNSLANMALPSTFRPNAILAWWWDDLDPSTGGQATWSLTGPVGNHVLTLVFRGIPRFGRRAEVTAAIRLFEADGVIEVQYGEVTIVGASDFDASAGWEDGSGGMGADALGCSPICGRADFPSRSLFRYIPEP